MAFGKRGRDTFSSENDWDYGYEEEEAPQRLDIRSLFSRFRKAEAEDYSDEYAPEDDSDEYVPEESYAGDGGMPYYDQPMEEDGGSGEYYDDMSYTDPLGFDEADAELFPEQDEDAFTPQEEPTPSAGRTDYAPHRDRPAWDEDGFWDEEPAAEPQKRTEKRETAEDAVPEKKTARFSFPGKAKKGDGSENGSIADLSRRTDYEAPATEKKRERETYEVYGEVPEEKLSGLNKALCALLGLTGVAALLVIAVSAFNYFGKPIPVLDKKTEAEPAPVVWETPASALSVITDPIEVTEAPEEGPAETPEPSGTRAVLTAEGILVPGDRGPVVPERERVLHPDELAATTFIGNSFVEGMKLWSDIDKCDYVCADGVSLDNMIGNYLYFVTVRSYDAIYLTLGLNEIGWPVDSFISKYEKVIDYIRSDAYSKTATIYITSVMPTESIMETTPSESGSVIHLDTIKNFNEKLKDMCQRKGCWYLDVYSALADETGYLPADVAADDHVHFEPAGYKIWTNYLLNHYVDESMAEG